MRVTRRDLASARHPRPRRERDVQAAILEALRKLPGVVAFKTGAGSFRVDGRYVRMGHKGVSDIIGWREAWSVWECCKHPHVTHRKAPTAQFLAIEVKAKGKQPTDEQRAFLDAVKAAGGLAIVAYSVDDVLAALR